MGEGKYEATYKIRRIFVLDFQRFHGTDHWAHSHEYVLVDQFDEATFIIIWVTTAMDDPHLFDECALARLTSACQYTDYEHMLNNIP